MLLLLLRLVAETLDVNLNNTNVVGPFKQLAFGTIHKDYNS